MFFGGKSAPSKNPPGPGSKKIKEKLPSHDKSHDTTDLFGGMSVARRSKNLPRNTLSPTDDLEHSKLSSQSSMSAQDKVSNTTTVDVHPALVSQSCGLSRKRAKEKAAVAHSDEVAKLVIRARLKRFYTIHNPAKLAHIDTAMASYAGREDEMFRALVLKYGKEPDGPLDTDNDIFNDVLPIESFTTNSFEVVQGSWEEPPPFDAGDAGGFGNASDWGAASGICEWGADGAPESEGNAGWGENNGFGGFNNDAVGFNEVDDTVGFDTGCSADNGNDGLMESNHKNDVNSDFMDCDEDDSKSDSSSSTEEETMNERHRRELSSVKARIDAAEHHLAGLLDSISIGVRRRMENLDRFTKLEKEIDRCTELEKYEEAETANGELSIIYNIIYEIDQQMTISIKEAITAHDNLLKSVRDLGQLYHAQGEDLNANQHEEERRTTLYIMETSSRIEQQGEKVRADLERATRNFTHSGQELTNLQNRQKKIQDKINEQTTDLTTQKQKVTCVKMKLEDEVKDLEEKLNAKKRMLTDANTQIKSIDEKITVITDEYAGTLNEVGKLISEEQAKMEKNKTLVDALEIQEKRFLKDEKAFKEEEECMKFELRTFSSRIRAYRALGKDITSRQVEIINQYFRDTSEGALAAREKGKNFLAPVPFLEGITALDTEESVQSNASSGAAIGSDALKKKQQQLNRAQTRQANLEGDISQLKIQIQDVDKKIPILETAKKAAALTKQFKVAKEKTEEISAAIAEKMQKSADIVALESEMEGVILEVSMLTQEVTYEKEALDAHVSLFAKKYASILANSMMQAKGGNNLQSLISLDETSAVRFVGEEEAAFAKASSGSGSETPTTASILAQEIRDIDQLYIGRSPSRDAEGAEEQVIQKPSSDLSPLTRSSVRCLESLCDELLFAYPDAKTLLEEASKAVCLANEPATFTEVNVHKNGEYLSHQQDEDPFQNPQTVKEGGEEQDEVPLQKPRASPGASPVSSFAEGYSAGFPMDTEGADGWDTTPDNFQSDPIQSTGWGVTVDGFEEDTSPKYDSEGISRQIAELEKKIEEATEVEDYDLCEQLQEQINQLNSLLMCEDSTLKFE